MQKSGARRSICGRIRVFSVVGLPHVGEFPDGLETGLISEPGEASIELFGSGSGGNFPDDDF